MADKLYHLAVRGVLFDTEGRVLLMKRSAQCRHQPDFWEFPGGKVDPEERFEDALKREFQEETRLIIALDRVAGCGEWEREEYRIAYLFMFVKKISGQFQISDEHDDFKWMTAQDLERADVSPQLLPLRGQIVGLMKEGVYA